MPDSVQIPDEHVEQRLRSDKIAWFVTVRKDGRPHNAPVWFIWDGSNILLYSKPSSVKIGNLQHNQSVVLSLDNTNGGEDVIIVEGRAELLPSVQDSGEIVSSFAEKYSTNLKNMGWTIEAMLADYSQAIRVTPTRILTIN